MDDYGEGTAIEPTRGAVYEYLEILQKRLNVSAHGSAETQGTDTHILHRLMECLRLRIKDVEFAEFWIGHPFCAGASRAQACCHYDDLHTRDEPTRNCGTNSGGSTSSESIALHGNKAFRLDRVKPNATIQPMTQAVAHILEEV